MTQKYNKLQIRAEVLNAVKILDSGDKHTKEFLDGVLLPLQKIEDKSAILDVLTKEIILPNSDNRFLILSFLIQNLIPKEMLEEKLWHLLGQNSITDTTKSNIINILKDMGNQISYDKYSEYFENPDSVINADTEKMLKSAIYNPEAQIDFMDFIEALPENDRSLLIDSLCEDYKGDELANLFSPVIYSNPNSNLCKDAVKRLGESKSALAIAPLQFLIEYCKNDDIVNLAKKSLSSLKLSGARKDISHEFYSKVLEGSKTEDIFVSMPDGHNNVGLLVSRKRHNRDSVQMFAVVFNDLAGIIDCFGFNDITESEFSRIVSRFYSNQEKICLTPSVAKLLLKNAEKQALLVNGEVSYEYVCWRKLLIDAPDISEPIENIFSKNLEITELTLNDLEKLYITTIFDKWFFRPSDNKAFGGLAAKIVSLTKESGYENLFEKINGLTKSDYSKIWTQDEINRTEKRLLFSAYLLNLNGLKKHANQLYSIIHNSEIKNALLTNMLKVSIYEFLLGEKEKYQNTAISTNIFSRRNNANKSLIEQNILNYLIKEIENNWGF